MRSIPAILADDGLAICERACRALAARYRDEATRVRNPIVRAPKLDDATKFERLADRLKRAVNGVEAFEL